MSVPRILLVIALPLLLLPAAVQAGGAGDQKPNTAGKDFPEHLTSADINKVVTPFVPDIRACYEKHAIRYKKATGKLRIELVIEAVGLVRTLAVVAPGVRGNKLATCIEKFAKRWEFPQRQYATRASLPFYFQRTPSKKKGGTR